MDREQNIQNLKIKLQALGVQDGLEEDIRKNIAENPDHFSLTHEKIFGFGYRDQVNTYFQIERNQEDNYFLANYEITRLKEIDIDPNIAQVHGADELEERLLDLKSGDAVNETLEIEQITGELTFLKESGEEAALIARQLEAKYWLNTPYADNLNNEAELHENFEDRIILKGESGPDLTIDEADKLFDGRAILKRSTVYDDFNAAELNANWYQLDDKGKLLVIPEDALFNIREEIALLLVKETVGLILVEEIASALEMGNEYELTYLENGVEEKVKIFADPLMNQVGMDFTDNDRELSMLLKDTNQEITLQGTGGYSTMSGEEISDLDNIIIDRGFNRYILPVLHGMIESGQVDFQLETSGKINEIEYASTLGFIRHEKTGKVIFDNFEVTIHPDDTWQNEFNQSFKASDKLSLTLPQALNLMEERSVSKTLTDEYGSVYKPWVKLNFERVDEEGNFPVVGVVDEEEFNLRDVLPEFSIANIEYPAIRNRLQASLENGNLHLVTIPFNGKPEQFYVSANSGTRTLDIYDRNRQLMPVHKFMTVHQNELQDIQRKTTPSEKELQSGESNEDRIQKSRGRR